MNCWSVENNWVCFLILRKSSFQPSLIDLKRLRPSSTKPAPKARHVPLVRTPWRSREQLGTVENCRRRLRTVENCWRRLRTVDDNCGLQTTIANCWRQLRTVDDSWELLTTAENCWRQLIDLLIDGLIIDWWFIDYLIAYAHSAGPRFFGKWFVELRGWDI